MSVPLWLSKTLSVPDFVQQESYLTRKTTFRAASLNQRRAEQTNQAVNGENKTNWQIRLA